MLRMLGTTHNHATAALQAMLGLCAGVPCLTQLVCRLPGWMLLQALFGTLTPDVMVLTVLYSLAGLGIAIVNDFKSIEGDRCAGLRC